MLLSLCTATRRAQARSCHERERYRRNEFFALFPIAVLAVFGVCIRLWSRYELGIAYEGDDYLTCALIVSFTRSCVLVRVLFSIVTDTDNKLMAISLSGALSPYVDVSVCFFRAPPSYSVGVIN